MVPESFRTDVLKEELDSNNVLVENANVETANFALLFEFDGDIRKIRHVLYNCAASRPSIESQTNEDEVEVQTETLALTATPLANGYVKAKTGDDTTDEIYQNWYGSVYMPVAETTAAVKSTASSTASSTSKSSS
jgi:phi13 family phage major tail protein